MIRSEVTNAGPRQRPARPPAPVFAQIAEELKALARWLCWRYSDRPRRNGQHGKVPYTIADRRADYTDHSTWLPFNAACRQYSRGDFDGIGLVLGEGLCGLDEDHCVLPDGSLEPEAASHIEHLNTYSERSVSGRGVHSLAIGHLPPDGRKRGRHEMYCDKRYFAVTGQKLAGAPGSVMLRDRELCEVHAMIFGTRPESSTVAFAPSQNRHTIPPLYTGKEEEGIPLDETQELWSTDDSVVRMILRDSVARKYWKGYPPGENPSSADFCLALKLAFYTRKNLHQMQRLFEKSDLFGREKHLRRPEYLRGTLEKARSAQREVWRPKIREEGVRRGTAPGRGTSARTKAVIAIARHEPWLKPREIAERLSLKPGAVRMILHRHLRDKREGGCWFSDRAA